MALQARFLSSYVRATALLTLGLCLSAEADLYAGDRGSSSDLVPTLITFQDTPGPSEQAFLCGLGGRIKYTYDIVPTIAAWIPEEAIAALSANSGVVRVEPDVKIRAFDTELTNSWGVQHIGAGAAHAAGITGAGVRVGIIDSGIDYTHPDLSPNYAGGWDFVNNDADPRDDLGHGTQVAGIIGAADNGFGAVGVAPEASLYAYKVYGASGPASESDIIAALSRAIADQIDVVNISLGDLGTPSQAFQDAFDQAAISGIVLVASAGNFGTFDGEGDNVAYPARYSSVIAVGATMNIEDDRAFFSSTGPDLELMAPGFEIYTTDLFGLYSLETGTSFAAPHVAGTAALWVQRGVSDVRDALISTAIDLGPEGFDTLYGYGLVNASAVIPAPSALGLAFLGVALVHRKRRQRTATPSIRSS